MVDENIFPAEGFDELFHTNSFLGLLLEFLYLAAGRFYLA